MIKLITYYWSIFCTEKFFMAWNSLNELAIITCTQRTTKKKNCITFSPSLNNDDRFQSWHMKWYASKGKQNSNHAHSIVSYYDTIKSEIFSREVQKQSDKSISNIFNQTLNSELILICTIHGIEEIQLFHLYNQLTNHGEWGLAVSQ